MEKSKPGFYNWVLHSSSAYSILTLMSTLIALAIPSILLIISFVFDYNILFKILFTLLTIYQVGLTIKAFMMRKQMNNTIHQFAYQGKFTHVNKYINKEEKKEVNK